MGNHDSYSDSYQEMRRYSAPTKAITDLYAASTAVYRLNPITVSPFRERKVRLPEAGFSFAPHGAHPAQCDQILTPL